MPFFKIINNTKNTIMTIDILKKMYYQNIILENQFFLSAIILLQKKVRFPKRDYYFGMTGVVYFQSKSVIYSCQIKLTKK